MADVNETLKDFEAYYSSVGDAEAPLPERVSELYELEEASGSDDSLLFKLRRRSDNGRAVLRCCPLSSGRAAREYEILRSLSDVNGVPRALDYFELDGCGWLLRSWAEGEDLASAVRRSGPLPADRVLSVMRPLCAVVARLHAKRPPVVHRDIKPQNVVLSEGGEVTLIDFDASRRYDSGASSDTEYLGTRAFAPPEQYGYAQTDPRSDVYSLGVLMLYLGTGSCELDRADELPERLRGVFTRCTAFAPDGRYADASELASALSGRRVVKPGVAAAAVGAATLLLCAAAVFFSSKAGSGAEDASRSALASALNISGGEGVYMLGDDCYATRDEFYAARSQNPDSYGEGAVSDVSSLGETAPRLRELMLASEPITDISGIEGLPLLETLNLDYTGITALDGVGSLARLSSISVTDAPVSDVSAISGCVALDNLCLRGIPCRELSALKGFSSFNFLDIASIPCASWLPYLEGCSVAMLKADHTGLESAAQLGGLSGLETLEINNNSIVSLDGIERFPSLAYLNIANNPVADFTPLASLRYLGEVVCDESQRAALESAGGGFTITAVK